MILPNPDRLNRFNKYALVMLVAKRAKQLQEQGIARRAMVRSSSQNPLTVALEEVAVGRLVPSFHPEPLPELMEPEPTETTLITHEFEEVMAKMAAETEHLHRGEMAEETDNSGGVPADDATLQDEWIQQEAEELPTAQIEPGLDFEDEEPFSPEEPTAEESSDS